MRVKYFAVLRNITHKAEEDINAKTINELLQILIAKYGKEFESQFFENGHLKKGVNILKNGRNILHLSQLSTPLAPNDTVSMFLPLAGG